MRAKELRGRDAGDLRREMGQLRRELFDLKFQWQAEESPNSSRRRQIRRDIARYETVLREMELQQQASAKREGQVLGQVSGAADE